MTAYDNSTLKQKNDHLIKTSKPLGKNLKTAKKGKDASRAGSVYQTNTIQKII